MNRNRIPTTLLAAMIATAFASAHAADAPSTAAPSNDPQQTTDTSASNSQSAPAKKPGTTSDSKQKDAVNLSGVVVTPLRNSLQSAQSLKQDARMVVDSIVAEDIGKLPDNSVADAMQRITGVQVAQGFQGETTSVVIRGLPNVITTLNGREIDSGTGRSFAFQNLPATAVKTISVYKSSDASQPDGGIAGVVDMQLYRPFDFQGPKLAATFTETHSQYGGHSDPNFSVLMSDRWNTDAGEFGALLNASFMAQHYQYNAVWDDVPVIANTGQVDTNGNPIPVRTANGNLVAVPNALGADYNIGYRQRPELNYALQWKPNDSTEFYYEALYDWMSDHYDQPFYFTGAGNSGIPASNLTVGSNCYANQLTGSPYQGQTICDATSGQWSGNNYTATSTQAHSERGHDLQHAIGVKWHGDRLQLSSDLSYNQSSFQEDNFIIDTFLKGPIDSIWSGTAGNHSNWSLGGNPQLDPNNYYLNGLFQSWSNQRSHQYAWRADGTFDINNGFFQYLDFGVRYADHKAESEGSTQVSTPPPGGSGSTAAPNPANQVTAVFPNGYFCAMPTTSALPTTWLTGCYNYLTENANALRNFYGLPAGLAPQDPGAFFNIDEKTYAGYAQVGYGNDLFGMPFDGLIGFRMERVKRNLDAYSFDASTSIYSPLSLSTSAPVYLPNLSFNWHFTDNLQLRLDGAKTVTYPGFGQLNPSLSLNPATINRQGVASSGNAYLKPIKSTNYDASLEWYFAPAGYVSAGAFYRDINGYIQNYVTDVTINGGDYQLNSPQSAGSGHLDGAELAYQQFFDFLPGALSGLGLQLNYTFIQGSTRSPQYIGGPVVASPLQGVSKTNYNAVLMYEKYGISARLAYDYRSRFIDGFNQPNVAGVYDEIVPANELDFSIGYDLNKYTTVVATATNLLGNDLHQYWGDGTTRPRDIRYQDRTIGLGIRLKL
ncbi:TonB-dependent receptor [Rhodanobacter koreensis]